MRVGWGIDVHRFGEQPGPIRLGGVEVPAERALEGTSDADVLTHAVCDALLGAAALGDMGEFFPSTDPVWNDADSIDMLGHVVDMVDAAGFSIGSIDVTVVSERVRVAPHRERMRDRIAGVLHIDKGSVSVKATTTDGLGVMGRDEGMAAFAVATIEERA